MFRYLVHIWTMTDMGDRGRQRERGCVCVRVSRPRLWSLSGAPVFQAWGGGGEAFVCFRREIDMCCIFDWRWWQCRRGKKLIYNAPKKRSILGLKIRHNPNWTHWMERRRLARVQHCLWRSVGRRNLRWRHESVCAYIQYLFGCKSYNEHYIHTYVHVWNLDCFNTHAHMCVCIHISICVCLHICTCICGYVQIFVPVYMHMDSNTRANVFTCVCIHTLTHTDAYACVCNSLQQAAAYCTLSIVRIQWHPGSWLQWSFLVLTFAHIHSRDDARGIVDKGVFRPNRRRHNWLNS